MSRAEAILQAMKLFYSAGVRNVKPSIVTDSSIMSVLSSKKDPSAGTKADKYLHEMKDSSIKLNDILYMKVIRYGEGAKIRWRTRG